MTGVVYLMGETLGHTRNVEIVLGTPDWLVGIEKPLLMRLSLGVTWKSGVVLASEMILSLSEQSEQKKHHLNMRWGSVRI